MIIKYSVFLCLAIVAIECAPHSENEIHPEHHEDDPGFHGLKLDNKTRKVLDVYSGPEPVHEYHLNPNYRYISAQDCLDHYNAGRHRNGVYIIQPAWYPEPFPVYCNMEEDGGGWTVIQRRGPYGNPENYFNRNWDDYKTGFGNLKLEHWLGNEKISAVTGQGKYALKMDVTSSDWTKLSYRYTHFEVGNELDLYKLTIGGYVVSGADFPVDDFAELNGLEFSTYDRDNDPWHGHCAAIYGGAWWYRGCADILLNANKPHFSILNKEWIHLRHSRMMVRRENPGSSAVSDLV